jgi:hypothetical protein
MMGVRREKIAEYAKAAEYAERTIEDYHASDNGLLCYTQRSKIFAVIVLFS